MKTLEPVRYSPTVEVRAPDEDETASDLASTMRKILDKTYADYGHAVRSVHAKSHGLLRGRLRVLPDLPPELAQGLFSAIAEYDLIMRISTIPGDILDDGVSTPRGLALKVLGVSGARLPGSSEIASQDFVLANGPVFNAPSGKAFLRSLKLLAATTDHAEGAKKLLSSAMRGVERIAEALGTESAAAKTLGGQPQTHLLGDSYFSQAPIRYGDYMAKISVAPISPELVALTDAPLDLTSRPDALREAVIGFFEKHGGVWELRAQLCTDLAKMPIEDPSVEWPEKLSAYRAVALIEVPPQDAWSVARSEAIDDGMAFSVWHGIEAHRPLGSIMRLRQSVYDMSAQFRSGRNRCPVRDPSAT